ncbi:MAG: hypothetical protein IPO91_19195 [Chloroflexi bacterium]|jgi:hypothetical protein|nr:hypothetical protein [Chloroflexota bacterium]
MNRGGYLLIVRDHQRQVRMSERIEQNKYFTNVVVADKWRGQERELALVSLDGKAVEYICLVERRQQVATFQIRLHFSRFYTLEEPITFETIRSGVQNRVQRYFDAVSYSPEGQWITPATWDEVIRVISSLQPRVVSSLDELNALRVATRRIYDSAAFDVLAEEKDAYASLVRFAGFQSVAEPSVTAWRPNRDQINAAPISFLASVRSIETQKIVEDEAIAFDSARFGDWQQLKQFVTGERIFHKENDALLIRNVNKQPLEETLGVDLIYYNYSYRAFVLVQYKRMERENGSGYRYRPDDQFEIEIARMRAFELETTSLMRPPTSLTEYRLNNGAFYFKFHEDEIFDPVNASLIPGIHIPLDYWTLFEASEQARGPYKGKFVGYENVGRYLNNTDFEAIVKRGFVGSSGLITDVLVQIVKPLVLDLKHSVTIGVKV